MPENISLTAEIIAEACDVLLAQCDQRVSVKYDSAFAYAGRLGEEEFSTGLGWSSADLLRMEELRSKNARDVAPKPCIDTAQGG